MSQSTQKKPPIYGRKNRDLSTLFDGALEAGEKVGNLPYLLDEDWFLLRIVSQKEPSGKPTSPLLCRLVNFGPEASRCICFQSLRDRQFPGKRITDLFILSKCKKSCIVSPKNGK